MMKAFNAAKTNDNQTIFQPEVSYMDPPMYVPQLMLLKDGPVTMTTMKLNIQLEAVLNALAGARIRNPTISAGYVIISSSQRIE